MARCSAAMLCDDAVYDDEGEAGQGYEMERRWQRLWRLENNGGNVEVEDWQPDGKIWHSKRSALVLVALASGPTADSEQARRTTKVYCIPLYSGRGGDGEGCVCPALLANTLGNTSMR